jgi:dihydrofolate reductase
MVGVTTTATAVLLGRKNYQGFGSYWPPVATDPAADPRDRRFAQWLNAVEKIVFSSTLDEASWENSRIVDTDPATIIDALRQQAGGDIIVLASSSVMRSLLRAEVLDRLSITLCPEVSSGGARLFEDDLPSSSWTLRRRVVTESGALYLVYDRVRAGNERPPPRPRGPAWRNRRWRTRDDLAHRPHAWPRARAGIRRPRPGS